MKVNEKYRQAILINIKEGTSFTDLAKKLGFNLKSFESWKSSNKNNLTTLANSISDIDNTNVIDNDKSVKPFNRLKRMEDNKESILKSIFANIVRTQISIETLAIYKQDDKGNFIMQTDNNGDKHKIFVRWADAKELKIFNEVLTSLINQYYHAEGLPSRFSATSVMNEKLVNYQDNKGIKVKDSLAVTVSFK